MGLDDAFVYYSFDSNNGELIDTSGNGNTLTNNGATLTTGKINEGFSFDGTNDYLYSSTNFPAIYSLSFWFKTNKDYTTSTTSNRGLFGDSSDTRHLLFGSVSSSFSNELITIRVNSDFQYWTTSQLGFDTIIAGNYNNIIIIWDSSNNKYRLYYNGIDKGLATVYGDPAVKQDFSNLYIGTRYNSEYFTGIIDELGFWGRTLTTDEISELYNNGDGLNPYAPKGWSNKINGITSNKINGIDITNISKVNNI